jgi:hypothetical protein
VGAYGGTMQQPIGPVNQVAIIQYVTDTFTGVEVVRPTDGPGAGDTFFFYDPERNIDPTRRLPFTTIVTKDYGDFDATSNLNRADVFRLNVGVSRDTFRALFGFSPSEIDTRSADYDFATLDRLMPHPAYARQSWVCVLNPGSETFEAVKPLLAEAYSIVATRHVHRQPNRD